MCSSCEILIIRFLILLLQASPRSGVVKLHLDEETQRVFLKGKAVVVAEGSLLV